MKSLDRRDFLKKSLIAAGGISVGGTLLAACADDGEPDSPTGPFSSRITVSTHPFAMDSAPYFLGLEEGLWEKHDWDIEEILSGAGGGATVRSIVTGDIPIGHVSVAAAFQAWLSGAPLRPITQSQGAPTELIYIAPKGQTAIQSLDDLPGKRMGFTNPGSGSQAVAVLAMDQLNLTDKVELVATGGISEGVALLDRGEIELSTSLESLFFPIRDEYEIVFRASDFLPRLGWGAMIVSNSFATENRERVQSFLAGRAEAVERTYEDPDAAAQAWFEGAEDLPLEGLRQTVQSNVDAEGYMTYGWDPEGLKFTFRGMLLSGAIESYEEIPLNELIDQSFIPEDQRIDLESIEFLE